MELSNIPGAARIVSKSRQRISPWVEIVEKQVEFEPGQSAETYHALGLADYVAILARTRSGSFPIVRQYRPAVEQYTLELPAGLVEPGESPEACCRREMFEETGLEVESLRYFGAFLSDTGRLENRIHVFFVQTSDPNPDHQSEPGIEVELVDFPTLRRYVLEGRFDHQLHLGVLGILLFRANCLSDSQLEKALSEI